MQQKYNLTLMDTISDKESISQEQTSCSLMLNEIRKEFCDILQSKFSLEQGNFVPDTEVSPYFSICWFGVGVDCCLQVYTHNFKSLSFINIYILACSAVIAIRAPHQLC